MVNAPEFVSSVSGYVSLISSILKARDGMPLSYTMIQRHCGIIDPREENERKKVWQVSAALARLVKEKHIMCDYWNGVRYYCSL